MINGGWSGVNDSEVKGHAPATDDLKIVSLSAYTLLRIIRFAIATTDEFAVRGWTATASSMYDIQLG